MAKTGVKRLLGTDPVNICFLTHDEYSRSLAEKALPGIRAFLKRELPEFEWELEQVHKPEELPEPVNSLGLLDRAYVMMLEEKWDFCFVAVKQRLESSQSRSEPLKVSPAHAAGVMSLEPLEPLSKEGSLAESAFTGLFIEGFLRLNGLRKAGFDTALLEGGERKLSPEERDHLRSRLAEVARVLPQERLKEVSRFFAYLWVLLRHPWKVLRSVGSNHPWRMVARSTRIIFGALATVLLSIVTMEFWDLALGQRPYRTILLGVGVICLTSVYVIWKHHLMVRPKPGQFNEQLAVFNLSTIITVILGFTLLYHHHLLGGPPAHPDPLPPQGPQQVAAAGERGIHQLRAGLPAGLQRRAAGGRPGGRPGGQGQHPQPHLRRLGGSAWKPVAPSGCPSSSTAP